MLWAYLLLMSKAEGGSWLMACAGEYAQQVRSANKGITTRTECFKRSGLRDLLSSFALSLQKNLSLQRLLLTRLRQIIPFFVTPSRFAHLDYLLQ